jgi:hypothetical protein
MFLVHNDVKQIEKNIFLSSAVSNDNVLRFLEHLSNVSPTQWKLHNSSNLSKILQLNYVSM